MSLLGSILWRACRTPGRIAVIDDVQRYSYARLAIGAFMLADQIELASRTRHVGLMLPTGGAFPMSLLAAWILGRVAVPLNYLLSPDELAFIIQDSDIDTIITVRPMVEYIGGAQVIPRGIRLLFLEELNTSDFPTPRWPAFPAPDDLAVILYTSGTSGRPKGVMLSHGNLASNVDASIEHARLTHADTFFGVLPQFHSFGLTALTLIPLRIGSRVIYTARFVPRRIVELIRQHRPDIMMAVPSMYGALLSVKSATAEDFSSVRLAISGGEPLPHALYETFLNQFNLQILEGYGLTETSPVTNWSTKDRHKLHSVGRALPGVREFVIDEQGQVLGPNQEGEIVIAGPNIMQGYYKQPELTAQVMMEIRPPGSDQPLRVFRTGDMGRIDEEGYLYITGRKKEMLIIGGENVFPREIEEVLNRHPAIKDSAVIGKPDGLRGEVPVAFVEINEGAQFDEAEVRSFCRKYLAQFKVPRDVQVVEQLPRSPTGKILRRRLAKE
ncbi:MAG TPA: AMP-binding protein [Phycisphaeraceae bacterium]